MNLSRVVRGLVVAAVASVVLSVALALLADAPATVEAMRLVPVPVLFWMLAFTTLGFGVRALRWGWFMRISGHPVSARDALYLQLAGQAMGVTPGRVGELVKPWLSKEVAGMPMSAGVALLFTERVADLIGVCILSLVGLSILGAGGLWLVIGLGLVVAATAVVASPRFHRLSLRFLGRFKRAERLTASVGAAFSVMERSLSPKRLAAATPVSVLSWGAEGVGFVLCVEALGFTGVSPAALVSIYAASTIIGAFTFLPGGIGLTEASLAGILVATGMPAPDAAAVTIVARAATLWWGVAVGWVALAARPSILACLKEQRQET